MSKNPIAALLGFTEAPPEPIVLRLNGNTYDLFPATEHTCEALYLVNAGYGHSNPAFTLAFVPENQRKMVLGGYLARVGSARRLGVKRAEAEAIVDACQAERVAVL